MTLRSGRCRGRKHNSFTAYLRNGLSEERQCFHLQAFARTDAQGKFVFKGLAENSSYEVLPYSLAFSFGGSKGVQQLEDIEEFSFYQSPHKLRLLSAKDFNNLKREKSLIVRMPDEAERWYWIIVGIFFTGLPVTAYLTECPISTGGSIGHARYHVADRLVAHHTA
jgi:hypothetical protein